MTSHAQRGRLDRFQPRKRRLRLERAPHVETDSPPRLPADTAPPYPARQLTDCARETWAEVTDMDAKFHVTGDHPILARADKAFDTFAEAVRYQNSLIEMGYENVTILRRAAASKSLMAALRTLLGGDKDE